MKSQWLSSDRIAELQFEKLSALLRFVWEHNSFYRTRLDDAGVHPDNVKSLTDLARLPILTKDDIREHRSEMISDGYAVKNLLWKRTGGSTGVPLQLYWDDEANSFKDALTFRHDSWAGFWPGRKRAALWGDTDKEYSFKEKLINLLCTRTIALDTLKMDDAYILKFIDRMKEYDAHLLFGHGHSIYFFTRFLADHNITDLDVKGIISTAEALPPEERKVVEEVFGNVVFDRYGCEEVSIIASECEAHDGMHIAAEGIYVEVLDGDETTPGRLVITDLTNRAMPLIRYEVGDLATTSTGVCSCGRGLPRLGGIMGRTSDILYTPDGRMISGVSVLDTFTIHIPGFKQVQIVQEKLDQLVFKIVRAEDFTDASLEGLAKAVAGCFGQEMKHRVEFVDSISMTARGKFQFSISKLQPEDIP